MRCFNAQHTRSIFRGGAIYTQRELVFVVQKFLVQSSLARGERERERERGLDPIGWVRREKKWAEPRRSRRAPPTFLSGTKSEKVTSYSQIIARRKMGKRGEEKKPEL